MSRVYAEVANTYEHGFEMPFRKYFELASVLQILGSVEGLSVLEVGCGTGHYSRLIRKAGALRVAGVDISEEMIQIGRDLEHHAPLGVEYIVRDVGALEYVGSFDVVLGVYLLHYARSQEHLWKMCQNIALNLKPGGRFISYHTNPDFAREPADYYLPYGFQPHDLEHLEDGGVYALSIDAEGFTAPKIPVYYWSKASYEAAFAAAGLTVRGWYVGGPSPEGISAHGHKFWEPMLKHPYSIFVECLKQQ